MAVALTPTEVRVLERYRREWISARNERVSTGVAQLAIRRTAKATGLSWDRTAQIVTAHQHRLRLGPRASAEDRTLVA